MLVTILATLTQEKISGYDQNRIRLYFHDHVIYSQSMIGMLVKLFPCSTIELLVDGFSTTSD